MEQFVPSPSLSFSLPKTTHIKNNLCDEVKNSFLASMSTIGKPCVNTAVSSPIINSSSMEMNFNKNQSSMTSFTSSQSTPISFLQDTSTFSPIHNFNVLTSNNNNLSKSDEQKQSFFDHNSSSSINTNFSSSLAINLFRNNNSSLPCSINNNNLSNASFKDSSPILAVSSADLDKTAVLQKETCSEVDLENELNSLSLQLQGSFSFTENNFDKLINDMKSSDLNLRLRSTHIFRRSIQDPSVQTNQSSSSSSASVSASSNNGFVSGNNIFKNASSSSSSSYLGSPFQQANWNSLPSVSGLFSSFKPSSSSSSLLSPSILSVGQLSAQTCQNYLFSSPSTSPFMFSSNFNNNNNTSSFLFSSSDNNNDFQQNSDFEQFLGNKNLTTNSNTANLGEPYYFLMDVTIEELLEADVLTILFDSLLNSSHFHLMMESILLLSKIILGITLNSNPSGSNSLQNDNNSKNLSHNKERKLNKSHQLSKAQYAYYIIDENLIKRLLLLLQNFSTVCPIHFRNTIFTIFKNIAIHKETHRNLILNHSQAINKLVDSARYSLDSHCLDSLYWIAFSHQMPTFYEIHGIVQLLSECLQSSQDAEMIGLSCQGFVKMCDDISDVEHVIRLNVVSECIRLLSHKDPQIVYDALTILAKIAYIGSNSQIYHLVENGAVEALVELIQSPTASSSLFPFSSYTPPLSSSSSSSSPSSCFISSIPSNFSSIQRDYHSSSSSASLDTSSTSQEQLSFNNSRSQLSGDISKALFSSVLFSSEISGLNPITNSISPPQKTQNPAFLSQNSAFTTKIPTVRTPHHQSSPTRSRACNVLGNIGCETPREVQAIIESNAFPLLVKIFRYDPDHNTRIEAAYAVCASASRADRKQVGYIMSCTSRAKEDEFDAENNCMQLIADMLELVYDCDPTNASNLKLCKAILRGLDNILNKGNEEAVQQGLFENPYAFFFKNVQGHRKLEQMQFFPEYTIVTKTHEILTKYFSVTSGWSMDN